MNSRDNRERLYKVTGRLSAITDKEGALGCVGLFRFLRAVFAVTGGVDVCASNEARCCLARGDNNGISMPRNSCFLASTAGPMAHLRGNPPRVKTIFLTRYVDGDNSNVVQTDITNADAILIFPPPPQPLPRLGSDAPAGSTGGR